ncbi:hypothetical protein QBC32DRAFT_386980, partial [Pseudoneurospora amorphoporcata]
NQDSTRGRDYSRNRSRDRSSNRNRDGNRDRSRNRSTDYNNRTDNRGDTRDGARANDRGDARNRYRSRSRDYNRDRSRDRNPGKDQAYHVKEETKAEDFVNFAGDDSDGYASDSSVYHVYSSQLTCSKCLKEFDSVIVKTDHARGCNARPSRVDAVPAISLDKKFSNCRDCKRTFSSRNSLFEHLDSYKGKTDGIHGGSADAVCHANQVGHAKTPSCAIIPFKVQNAVPQTDELSKMGPLSGFTHLRVLARATPEAEESEVCIDPGAAKTIIGRSFLQTLEHSISTEYSTRIKGVGGKPTKLTKWATFTFYLPGTDSKGNPTLLKTKAAGWVIDELEPNLLLANSFLHPRQAHIDYRKAEVRLPQDNFSTAFEVLKPPNRCLRKVVTEKKVILRPGEERMVPVHYVSLPKDRNFLFDSSHPAVVSAVVDARSPRVALVKNTTSGTITIPRKQKVGMITECGADGYFAASWASICETAMVTQVLSIMESDPTLTVTQATEAVCQVYSVPANVELDINLDDIVPADEANSTTEASDSTPAPEATTPIATEPTPLPSLPDKQSTLGIRIDDKAPGS